MTTLPDPQFRQPHATTAGQPNINTAATSFLNDLESAFTHSHSEQWKNTPSFRDSTPIPAIGDAPPVAQPGRPPMSEAATNISGVMIASSVPILALGAAATGVLWGSGHADPTVIAWMCAGIIAAPAAIAAPILALTSLMKSAKQAAEAAPPVIHQHYTGTVHQDARTLNTTNRGIIANTRNQLPR